jgi:hypothetical protein
MLHVGDRLLEQVQDVVVVEVVENPTALAATDDKAQVAEKPKLVGDGRGLHPNRLGEVIYAERAAAQAAEDPDAARGGQRLHGVRHRASEARVELIRVSQPSVGHPHDDIRMIVQVFM